MTFFVGGPFHGHPVPECWLDGRNHVYIDVPVRDEEHRFFILRQFYRRADWQRATGQQIPFFAFWALANDIPTLNAIGAPLLES